MSSNGNFWRKYNPCIFFFNLKPIVKVDFVCIGFKSVKTTVVSMTIFVYFSFSTVLAVNFDKRLKM